MMMMMMMIEEAFPKVAKTTNIANCVPISVSQPFPMLFKTVKSSKPIIRSGLRSTLCYLQNFYSYFINHKPKTRAKIKLMVCVNIVYIKIKQCLSTFLY